MQYVYDDNQLTNYNPHRIRLEEYEWARLGQCSLYEKPDGFILKNNEGKVLGEYNDLLSGVLALIETKKGEKNEQ